MTERRVPIAFSDAHRSSRFEFSAYASRRDWGNIVELSILAWSDERRWIGQPIVMEDMNIGDDVYHGPPTISMRSDFAQKVIDALWEAGLRPSGGHGSAGQLGATEKHLADMRAIVGAKLEVQFK